MVSNIASSYLGEKSINTHTLLYAFFTKNIFYTNCACVWSHNYSATINYIIRLLNYEGDFWPHLA